MSGLCMRMQPAETNPPMEPGLFVPWIASSWSTSTRAASPIGLLGAPDSMTATDAALQQDLARVDTELLDLTAAVLAGNQVAIDASRQLYGQTLPAINADIAAILTS